MAVQSHHFENLRNAYSELVSAYLPNTDPNVLPSPKEQEWIRAFIVLVHAELEYYFESICMDIADSILSNMRSEQYTEATVGIIAFSSIQGRDGGEQLIPGKKDKVRKVSLRVGEAVESHKQIISGNNGISQKYLASLFVPLGLTNNDIDPLWIGAIDSFADKRGAYAHKSRSHIEADPKNLNPHDVLSEAKRIIFSDPRLSGGSGGMSSVESFDVWALDLMSTSTSKSISHRRHQPLIKRLLWWVLHLVEKYSVRSTK